jgi:hypothetical protein
VKVDVAMGIDVGEGVGNGVLDASNLLVAVGIIGVSVATFCTKVVEVGDELIAGPVAWIAIDELHAIRNNVISIRVSMVLAILPPAHESKVFDQRLTSPYPANYLAAILTVRSLENYIHYRFNNQLLHTYAVNFLDEEADFAFKELFCYIRKIEAILMILDKNTWMNIVLGGIRKNIGMLGIGITSSRYVPSIITGGRWRINIAAIQESSHFKMKM